MKKIISLLTVLLIIFTVCGCKQVPADTGENEMTVGEFAEAISYATIKTEADKEQKYSEVSEPGWNTEMLDLNAVLTPQNAKSVIDEFLKQHFYTLDADIISELSLDKKEKLTTKDINNICDTLSLKLKEIKPKLSFDLSAVAKAEILDKSNVEHPKSLSITGEALKKLVDYINKTPITSIDYVGIASGIYKSVVLFDKDGNEIFNAGVNGNGFVNGYCQYTVDSAYLSVIFDNIK